jgi:branched-chain amino acid aminotransferase
MLNAEGHVAECTGDNVFLVRGGELWTPPAAAGILVGVTRAVVIALASKLNVPFIEKFFRLAEVYGSDEVFLTGTAAEIVPVAEVDGRRIGEGRPGPLTRRLMAAFAEETRRN